ncbi:putative protein kinase-like protein [Trypanosoma conorhini]|uniref:Uncharacterized protein n=1 Tax=Trypanosoma conorhini TaxID=83891 RepID=A0A3R7NRG5_9TRYP|nr:putative protein kinase-like protein [Trypanosoma conorhini]RNF06578.1 putative protein kinase-like protein [Trypanosoma conorhini]
MTGRPLPPPGIARAVTGLAQAGAGDAKRAPWTISTTEVLCARMHSWQSALDCYEFFRKRRLPIADEAVMSLLLRLQVAVKGDGVHASATVGVLKPSAYSEFDAARRQVHGETSLHLGSSAPNNDDGVPHSPPSPLAFLLHSTQYQPTLRPLYHRLRFITRDMVPSAGEASAAVGTAHTGPSSPPPPQALFSGLLPIISAPCAVVNLSLRHNLRKGRWEDALRTICNLSTYALLESYARELHKSRVQSDTTSVLDAVSHDGCYRACVYPPSLVPLMDELLLRWEAYWSALNGVTEAQRVLSGLLQSAPPPLGLAAAPADKVATPGEGLPARDEACTESSLNESVPNPLLMFPELEKSSLEVLRLAALITSYREYKDVDELQEEQEIFHRLTEATTRVAEFSVCQRVQRGWAAAAAACQGRRVVPSISTEQLLLTRLLLRAPSSAAVLQVLDAWPRLSPEQGCNSEAKENRPPFRDAAQVTLRCPEVVAALAARLPPLDFLEEVVNKRLSSSKVPLQRPVREVVRASLLRGCLYDAAEKFWMRQAHLELTQLCEVEEARPPGDSLVLLLQDYLSQRLSLREKMEFVSDLLHRVGEGKYAVVVESMRILDEEEASRPRNAASHHTGGLALLVQVMACWITEDHRLGGAAVLLRHILQVLDEGRAVSSEDRLEASERRPHSSLHRSGTTQEVMAAFFEAVARVGFCPTDAARRTGAEAETALQWLRLLAEVPSARCGEQTLVVWLFWTMRARIQWEEAATSSLASGAIAAATTERVLAAVRNLSAALEKCEEDAVLPPMLLNWLTSCTGMPWGDATAWLAKHAGVEASQRRRFLFIRLPLGHVAFDAIADAASRRKLLLSVERELQRETPRTAGGPRREPCHGNDCLEARVQELFNTIRHTLLRAWQSRALSPCRLGEMDPTFTLAPSSAASAHALPPAKHGLLHTRRRAHGDVVLCSLQEILRCLCEETPLTHDAAMHEER